MLTGNESRQELSRKKSVYYILVLLGIGILLILFLAFVKPFYSINLKLQDQLFVSEEPSPNIVIAGIDDYTLEKYGVWSDWPRSLHSKAIRNLSKARAQVIGFDILFTDSSSNDNELSAAIADAGNVVIPDIGLANQPSGDGPIIYSTILSPTSLLKEASVDTGHANISPDVDGTVRRLPLLIEDSEGRQYPAFSLSILNTLFKSPLQAEYVRRDGVLHLLSRDVPVDSRYYFRLNYSPDNEDRPFISYADIIDDNFDYSAVENKIVLVGMTATGERDKWMIPVSTEKASGIYIHATVIDNILNQRYLNEVGTGANLFIMFLLLGIAAFSLPHMRLRTGGILIAILMVAFTIVSFLCFEYGYVIDILYPLMIMPLIYIGNIVVRNAATMIENVRLHDEITDGYKGTIRALAASIEAKDHYTRGHSHRVTEYALLAANTLNIPRDDLVVLEYAGILHDIGKIGIPDNVLTKPDSLSREEQSLVREHPVIGANIISDVPFLSNAKKLVLYHHEKYDGTGYPEGLSGETIPLGARLLAVADAFDSMTSDRAYRPAVSIEDAISELVRCSGSQFCPVALKAFLAILNPDLQRLIRERSYQSNT